MKAAVLYDIKTPLQIEEFTLPDILPDQVRVRLVASGVCHSDWHVIKGDWPHIPVPTILGHEGAGVVEEVGEKVGHVRKGDHVVLSWKRNCGLCEMCQSGYPNLCDETPDLRALPRFTGSDRTMNKMLGLGTFSTETIVPGDVVIAIDKEIPLPQAALVGCGVMTGVGAALNTAGLAFGLNLGLIEDPAASGRPQGAGSYFWGGAAGTWFWVDPQNDVIFIGMIQRFATGGPNVDFSGESGKLVYGALQK